MGFVAPTPIQEAAIPAILRGADVVGSAQTGSGKTAAFALPLLQQLQAGATHTPRRVRALILVPTRELAAQVGEVVRSLAQHLPQPVKVAVVFGGVSINPQMMGLRGGADVVVATPGRLLDLVDHNALQLASVNLLVLDEADRLLDLGFAEELQRTLALLPARRQNLFFSATFPADVQTLAESLLKDPVRVAVADTPANEPCIVQRAIAVDASRRTQLLRHLVKENEWSRVLVFVATQYAAEHVAEKLYKAGIFATPFHGGLSQGARKQVLQEFKDDRWQVVVTTDLAARGPAARGGELRFAPLCGGLRAPHRPHGPRGRKRRGRELCQCRHRSALAPDREPPAPHPAARTDPRFRAHRGGPRGHGSGYGRHQGQAAQQEGQAARCRCSSASGNR